MATKKENTYMLTVTDVNTADVSKGYMLAESLPKLRLKIMKSYYDDDVDIDIVRVSGKKKEYVGEMRVSAPDFGKRTPTLIWASPASKGWSHIDPQTGKLGKKRE